MLVYVGCFKLTTFVVLPVLLPGNSVLAFNLGVEWMERFVDKTDQDQKPAKEGESHQLSNLYRNYN